MAACFSHSLSDDDPHPTCTSRTICSWICDKGHTWEVSPCSFHGCPHCQKEGMSVASSPSLLSIWNDEKSPETVTCGSAYVASFQCKKGHKWKAPVYSVARSQRNGTSGCPRCVTSVGEEELYHYVSSILPSHDVQKNTRAIISPYELDIYIPSQHIAIEFNGLYWHSENMLRKKGHNGKKYHAMKYQMCKDKGIQLITVWEDEWRDKQDIVKSMLAHKLGASQTRKVFARKTIVSPISSDEAREFLDAYHIQGYAQGTSYIGLRDGETQELVAVSVWRKNKGTLYLDRYATNCTVIGGMGKLLKEGRKCAHQHNCSTIVTFSDHQVSDGHLYEKLGFTFDGKIKPDYRYLVDGERKHKFGYRLKRFRTDDSLIYEEGKTEKELAHLNELDRIYDCGKTRWMMDV